MLKKALLSKFLLLISGILCGLSILASASLIKTFFTNKTFTLTTFLAVYKFLPLALIGSGFLLIGILLIPKLSKKLILIIKSLGLALITFLIFYLILSLSFINLKQLHLDWSLLLFLNSILLYLLSSLSLALSNIFLLINLR